MALNDVLHRFKQETETDRSMQILVHFRSSSKLVRIGDQRLVWIELCRVNATCIRMNIRQDKNLSGAV